MIELVMFFSGWRYFSKLRKRIEDLETQVIFLTMKQNESKKESEEWSIG